MSSFGRFSEDGREYIFHSVQAPRPMLNYLWNQCFLAAVNHLGGGDGAYSDRAAQYIHPESKARAPVIRDGNRYFYIRDDETGDYWNPGWYPAKQAVEGYRCVHGLGYSMFEGRRQGIQVSLRVFVNEEDPVEIWTVTCQNLGPKARKIKIYSFVEFDLTGYNITCDYYSNVSSEYVRDCNLIVAHNTSRDRDHHWHDGFIASSETLTGFETGKKAFLGTYGSIFTPETVVKGRCSDRLAACEGLVGVLENTVTLEAGGEVAFNVLIGAADSTETAVVLAEKLFGKGKIEADFARLRAKKAEMVRDLTIRTPDQRLDHIINNWAKQQVQLCVEMGRGTTIGYRDRWQDSWAMATLDPRLAKIKMTEALEHQYRDGHCALFWPGTPRHQYSDSPTWIAPAINAYLKESGDFDFLNQVVPYLDQEQGTVWEHILASVRYPSDDLGERHLVLAHDGDWNDSLNLIGTGGKGESVWTTIAVYNAIQNVIEMAQGLVNDKAIVEEMRQRAESLKTAVNEAGWDGQWYLAAYNDLGEKVGSHTEKEGSIFLNSQTWAVMTGIAEGERLKSCLQAIDERLDSPYGPLTCHPPYTAFNPHIGRLTGFMGGMWENGTPYCHGGAFKIVADCCVGRGNKAYESLRKILPDNDTNPSDHSGCEPYAFTNMYIGPSNPRAGQTKFAWVTGTAGWVFRAVTQYMMGFHPGYREVTLKPCLPDAWDECSLTRVYRGDTYRVRIVNRNQKQNTVKTVVVDGKPLKGNTFRIAGDRKEHRIEIEMA